jgi:hypothetical protein
VARSRKTHANEYASPDSANPRPSRLSRRLLLTACALLTLIVTFGYAGESWAIALYRLLADGVFLVAWLIAAAGFGATILLVLPLHNTKSEEDRETLLHWVTAIALGLGVISIATLGLGLAGWLSRASSFTMLGVGGVLGLLIIARSRTWRRLENTGHAIRAWLDGPAGWAWLWLLAMPFLGVAIVVALLPPGTMWPGEPHGYDVVEYHLQIPREWYEIGRIIPLQHNAFSFFPFNVEMQYVLAMHLQGGPWAGMYLAHLMHLAMIVLSVAAVYGLAQAGSKSKSAPTIASVLVATIPWLTQLGSIAYNEGGLLLFGTLATGWAFRAILSPSRRLGRFPVAGLLAGFACGSKLTAVPEVLVAVGGICAVAILLTRHAYLPLPSGEGRGEGELKLNDAKIIPTPPLPNPLPAGEGTGVSQTIRLIGVATFFLAGTLAFAPWLVRNCVWAGNPVFPEATFIFGQGHFSDAQVDRWKQAHSPRPDQQSVGARLSAWRTDVWASPQYGFVLLPLGVICGLAACWRQDRLPALLMIAMFAALCIVWLGFTHLQGRFFIFGVPIAGLLIAQVPWRRAGALVGAGIVVLAAVVSFAGIHQTVAGKLFGQKLNLVIGVENLSGLSVREELAEVVEGTTPIALIGDARVFLYSGPMSRITYRTVFDVDAQPGESVIDAWARGAPADAVRVVDPNELKRFHGTYRGIPALAPEFADRAEPFVVGLAP